VLSGYSFILSTNIYHPSLIPVLSTGDTAINRVQALDLRVGSWMIKENPHAISGGDKH
jgi:hypothetical protein